MKDTRFYKMLKINTLKNSNLVGSVITLLLAFLFFLLFFGSKMLTTIDTNFFSTTSSDLIKDLYTTSYSVKYDSLYLRNNPMNYPYGEHFTYTGNQVFISFPLKILTNLGLNNASEYVLPLINLHVILSIFLCSLFLFLLFKELKLSNIVSILGAVMITFLSPQLQRTGGHLTLSYVFIIPLILLLLAKINNNNRLIYNVLLGLLLIWSGFAHPYYLIFFAALSTIYWIYVFFYEKSRLGGTKKIILSYAVQFIIPYPSFLF